MFSIASPNKDLANIPDYSAQTTKADVTITSASPTRTTLYTAPKNEYVILTGIPSGNGASVLTFFINDKGIFGVGTNTTGRVVVALPLRAGDVVSVNKVSDNSNVRCLVYGFG